MYKYDPMQGVSRHLSQVWPLCLSCVLSGPYRRNCLRIVDKYTTKFMGVQVGALGATALLNSRKAVNKFMQSKKK